MLTRTRAALALGSFAGLAWMGTFAGFSDSVSGSSDFSTARVDLQLNGSDTDIAYTALSLSDMKPSSETYAPLTVRNNGSTAADDFSYTMTTTATNADGKGLGSALQLGIKVVANTGSCLASGFAASSTTLVTDGSTLSGAAVSARSLAASTNEVLCFHVKLPSSAANSLQGAATTATFAFAAS